MIADMETYAKRVAYAAPKRPHLGIKIILVNILISKPVPQIIGAQFSFVFKNIEGICKIKRP